MDGINFLNSYKIFDLSDMLSVILIMALFFVIAVFLYIGETNKTFAYIWGAVAIIGIIAAFVGFRFSGVHHEVLINDDVPFVEFHEKYEVVDERGEIFVIEERK